MVIAMAEAQADELAVAQTDERRVGAVHPVERTGFAKPFGCERVSVPAVLWPERFESQIHPADHRHRGRAVAGFPVVECWLNPGPKLSW